MFGLGTSELLLILLVILLLFGAKRLPELARSLGKGIQEFKKAARETQDELSKEIDDKKRIEEKKEEKKE